MKYNFIYLYANNYTSSILLNNFIYLYVDNYTKFIFLNIYS